jgi:hypothetical protein
MSEPKKLSFIPRGGVAEDIPFDLRENNMVYELAEFVRLINLGNRENPNTEFSRMEMAILDEIRRQNNVVFPADTVTERF